MMNEKLSNPGPLGLMAFGMTTVLLNFRNIGLYGLGDKCQYIDNSTKCHNIDNTCFFDC